MATVNGDPNYIINLNNTGGPGGELRIQSSGTTKLIIDENGAIKCDTSIEIWFGASTATSSYLYFSRTDGTGTKRFITQVSEDGLWSLRDGVGSNQIQFIPKDGGLDSVLVCGLDDATRGVVKIKRRVTATTKMGVLILEDKDGVSHFIWVDTTGDLRIDTTDPGTVDTGGTVVGTQS